MKLIGILLILNGIAISSWWIATQGTHKGTVLTLTFLAVFAGLALVISDRITELTVKGVGTIKAAAQKATLDAQAVADLRKRIEEQNAKLDKDIEEVNTTLVKLKTLAEFTDTVTKAKNEIGQEFDRLAIWANDPNYPHRLDAKQAWAAIMDEHTVIRSVSHTWPPSWASERDPSKDNLTNLKKIFSSATVPNRIKILDYIWDRKDFSKYERMAFLYDVLTEDDDLRVRYKAGDRFKQWPNLTAHPLDKEQFVEWWEKNKEKIRNEEEP